MLNYFSNWAKTNPYLNNILGGKMKKIINLFLFTLLTVSFISCSSISISHDYDPATDFSKYKTYAWGGQEDPNDALAKNPLIRERIYKAIDTVMQGKGYQKTKDNPDMLVFPHAGTKDKTQVTNYGGYGGYGGWGRGPYGYGGYGYGGGIDVSYYTEASIFLDIVDAAGKQLIWRGVGTGALKDDKPTPEESQKRALEVVSKILKNFPPEKE